MDSFHAFWDRINGKMYRNGGPTQYHLASYADAVTTGPINNTEDGDHNLRPLSHEDMGRYGADDVLAYNAKNARNTTKLGDPMSDMDFKKFLGQA